MQHEALEIESLAMEPLLSNQENTVSVSTPKTGGPHETEFRPLPVSDFLDTALENDAIEWILEDYLPTGGLVILAGKPKEGKTTLTYELVVKVAKGQPFLGRTTAKCGVLVLGLEEHPRDMGLRLRGLTPDGLDNLFIYAKPLSPTADTLEEIKQFVMSNGIKLILIDTLGAFWNVRDENDAAEVGRAVKPILDLARTSGACVLLIHHARKSEGTFGDEIRGSGALFAAVDVALILKRHEVETQRTLRAVSRYPDTPTEMVLELRESGYVSLGDPARLNRQAKRDKMKAALTEVWTEPKALAKLAGVPERDSHRLLGNLHTSGDADRMGTGRKGSPFQYRKMLFHATPPVLEGTPHETETTRLEFVSCAPPSPRMKLDPSSSIEEVVDLAD
jgi:predicted ATP-dependent serine protease